MNIHCNRAEPQMSGNGVRTSERERKHETWGIIWEEQTIYGIRWCTLFDFGMEIYRPNVWIAAAEVVRCKHHKDRISTVCSATNTCMRCRCIHKCIWLFVFHAVFICIHKHRIFCSSFHSQLYRRGCAFLIWIQFEAHIQTAIYTLKMFDYSLTQCFCGFKNAARTMLPVAYHLNKQTFIHTHSLSCSCSCSRTLAH